MVWPLPGRVSLSDCDRSISSSTLMSRPSVRWLMLMRDSGRWPALQVDQRAHGDVEIEFAAVFLVAQAHAVLRLEQVEQALELAGEDGVLFQQAVDVGGAAGRVQGFVDAGPVRPVVLRGDVPLRVMARRQAERLVVRLGRGGSKLSSSSPASMKVHRWRLSSR